MGEVVVLPCQTRQDIPVERVVDNAEVKALKQIFVVGENEAGELYLASSSGTPSYNLMLLQLALKRIVEWIDDGSA